MNNVASTLTRSSTSSPNLLFLRDERATVKLDKNRHEPVNLLQQHKVGKEETQIFRRLPSVEGGVSLLINTLGVPTAVRKEIAYGHAHGPLGKAAVVGHLHAPYQTIEPSFASIEKGHPSEGFIGLFEAPIKPYPSSRRPLNGSPVSANLRYGFGSDGATLQGETQVAACHKLAGGLECPCARCSPTQHVPVGPVRQVPGPSVRFGRMGGVDGGLDAGDTQMWQPSASLPRVATPMTGRPLQEIQPQWGEASGKVWGGKDAGGKIRGGMKRGNTPQRTNNLVKGNASMAGVIASRAMAGSRPTSSSKSLLPRMRPLTSAGVPLPSSPQRNGVGIPYGASSRVDVWTASDDHASTALNLADSYPPPLGTPSNRGQEGGGRWSCPDDRDEVMQRLARLEASLQEERSRRIAAEQLLMELKQRFSLS